MPKRTRDYHEFLLEQLTDPVFAAGYLNEARQDSQKMFLKALRNVAEAMETKPMVSNESQPRAPERAGREG